MELCFSLVEEIGSFDHFATGYVCCCNHRTHDTMPVQHCNGTKDDEGEGSRRDIHSNISGQ